jgi:hypothetical protein
LVLGEVTRSLSGGEDSQLNVKIERDNLLKVARSTAAQV